MTREINSCTSSLNYMEGVEAHVTVPWDQIPESEFADELGRVAEAVVAVAPLHTPGGVGSMMSIKFSPPS